MRWIALSLAAFCALTLSATPAARAAWEYERFAENRIAAGTSGTMVVNGDNGDVEMTATNTSTIVVRERFRAHDEATLAKSAVTMNRNGNRFELDARCPSTRRWFGYTNACEADVTIEYPRGMTVDVEWVNGDVRVSNAAADTTVHITNGDIVVRGAMQSLTLSARHGDVNATLDNQWHGRSIEAAVSEGDVTLQVPRRFAGYLDASVHLGDLSNAAHLPTSPSGANSVPVRASALIGDVTIRNL